MGQKTFLKIIALLVTFHFGLGQECTDKGRCSDIPLTLIKDVPSVTECWEKCRSDKKCNWYTFWEEIGDCFLFDKCEEPLVGCDGCQFGRVTCTPDEEFQLLLFGGFKQKNEVQLFPSLSDQSCKIKDLPESARLKPFGGFMEGNITICAGDMRFCYYLTSQSGDLAWSQSYALYLTQSSLVTSYDSNHWSFLAGYPNNEKVFTWKSGSDSFNEHELGFEIEHGACSARKNRTHAIVSLGSKIVYWYEEEGLQLQKWNENPLAEDIFHAGCGAVFHPDFGYQFISTGGRERNDKIPLDMTEVFDFDSNSWHEGANLPQTISQAASVPYKNSFLLVGGETKQQQFLDIILQYDHQNGWLELPIKLQNPDVNVGAMRVPKGKLQCP